MTRSKENQTRKQSSMGGAAMSGALMGGGGGRDQVQTAEQEMAASTLGLSASEHAALLGMTATSGYESFGSSAGEESNTWHRASVAVKVTASYQDKENEEAIRQVELAMRVCVELNAMLAGQSAKCLYKSAKKLQRAYRTHVFRQKISDSIKGYDGMKHDRDLEYVRKRNHTFKVILAREQEFMEHVQILQTKYQVPLQSITMVDSSMRRSYFQPEDHTRIFAGIDAVEHCSKGIIKRMNEGIKEQPRIDIVAALQDCVPLLADGYSQFCANQEWSEKTIRDCTKNSQDFRSQIRKTGASLQPAHSLGVKGLLGLDNLMEEVGMRLHTYENDLHQICHSYECPVHAEPSENFPAGCEECRTFNKGHTIAKPESASLIALVKDLETKIYNMYLGTHSTPGSGSMTPDYPSARSSPERSGSSYSSPGQSDDESHGSRLPSSSSPPPPGAPSGSSRAGSAARKKKLSDRMYGSGSSTQIDVDRPSSRAGSGSAGRGTPNRLEDFDEEEEDAAFGSGAAFSPGTYTTTPHRNVIPEDVSDSREPSGPAPMGGPSGIALCVHKQSPPQLE